MPGAKNSPSISLGPHGRGPIFQPDHPRICCKNMYRHWYYLQIYMYEMEKGKGTTPYFSIRITKNSPSISLGPHGRGPIFQPDHPRIVCKICIVIGIIYRYMKWKRGREQPHIYLYELQKSRWGKTLVHHLILLKLR